MKTPALLLATALLAAGCSSGSGLTQSQADGCNRVLDAGRDFVAQLKTLNGGGDQATVTSALGADVQTVRSEASKQDGKVASAMNRLATEMSRVQLDPSMVGQPGGVDALSSATDDLNSACQIKGSA